MWAAGRRGSHCLSSTLLCERAKECAAKDSLESEKAQLMSKIQVLSSSSDEQVKQMQEFHEHQMFRQHAEFTQKFGILQAQLEEPRRS